MPVVKLLMTSLSKYGECDTACNGVEAWLSELKSGTSVGGRGTVREVCDLILKWRDFWEEIAARYEL